MKEVKFVIHAVFDLSFTDMPKDVAKKLEKMMLEYDGKIMSIKKVK